MKQTFVMSHDIARQRAIQAVQAAPEGWAVVIKEPTRSLQQNALIHALLTDVGNSLNWKFNGQEVDIEDIKTIFVAAFRKATGTPTKFMMGLDGQPVILNWRTRDFSKAECSDFTEFVGAWMANREAA